MVNDFGKRFDLFRKTLKEEHRINTRELAEALGVSPSYLTDLAKGRIKEGGLRLWDGIRKTYSECEPYLRGTVDEPPSSAHALKVTSFEEKRAFNRKSGLTAEEGLDLAEWLGRNPECRELILAWARARVNGAFSGMVVDLFEVEAKAKARYLLQSVAKETDATGG
jgi:transcriptional regulator with XRE-family HTH domain